MCYPQYFVREIGVINFNKLCDYSCVQPCHSECPEGQRYDETYLQDCQLLGIFLVDSQHHEGGDGLLDKEQLAHIRCQNSDVIGAVPDQPASLSLSFEFEFEGENNMFFKLRFFWFLYAVSQQLNSLPSYA